MKEKFQTAAAKAVWRCLETESKCAGQVTVRPLTEWQPGERRHTSEGINRPEEGLWQDIRRALSDWNM